MENKFIKENYYDDLNRKLDELKRLLKIENQQNAFTTFNAPFKCCQNCKNNPRNNPYASGVCCCSLPDQEMIMW